MMLLLVVDVLIEPQQARWFLDTEAREGAHRQTRPIQPTLIQILERTRAATPTDEVMHDDR